MLRVPDNTKTSWNGNPTGFVGSVLGGTPGHWSAVVVVSVLALACFAPAVNAELIATDHFLGAIPGDPAIGEYDNTPYLNQFRRGNTNGGGQNPTIAGFTDPWSGNVITGSGGVAQWTAEAPPFDLGFVYQDGGRAKFSGVDNLQRRVQRELATYTPSDTYYMSFIAQVLTDELDLDGFVGIGFTNTEATAAATDANIVGGSGLKGLLVGSAGDGVSGTDYVVRHVGSTGVVQNDVILDDIIQNDPNSGTPFVRYTIVKLEFNDDPANTDGNSKISIWQDPSVLASEADATAAAAPLEFRTFALGANTDLTHMTFTGVDYSRAASFDEPRRATTWEEATGGVADFDDDGDTDGSDFLAWQRGFGITSGATREQGDANGDGAVNGIDLEVWKIRFGATPGAPAASGSSSPALAIPEPTSITLLLAALAGFATRVGGRVR